MLPEGAGSTRMSVKFYLIAMLFILFDIEVVFLYPWAVVYKEMLLESGGLILACMLSFLGISWSATFTRSRKRPSTGSANSSMSKLPPIQFGTSGWRGLIAKDFTFDRVRLPPKASRISSRLSAARKLLPGTAQTHACAWA